jgi:outer membrane receptor for ferrienterochelin and colicin
MTLLHASSRKHSEDINSDLFMDMPMFQTFNIMQRWQYLSFEGWESQLGFQILSDDKDGGTINSDNYSNPVYKYGSTNKLMNIYGKTGYVFPEDNTRSFGLQWAYNYYDNSSNYGMKNYNGNEKNLYLNFIYQTNILDESNMIRAGISFVYDELNEKFDENVFDRIERIPGVFIEYTYKPNDEVTVVAGLRGDIHNEFGFFLTPRLHARYSPHPDWVLRAAIGRGYRTSNIFTEYSSSFVSSRTINILRANDFGSGLEQESAWNYGINLTHYFLVDYRDAIISLDFYRTDFDKSTIADLDSSPQSINFSSVGNGAYSNTFQLELNFEPILFFNTRLAYKYIDSKQLINGAWLEKPFIAKHRALVNLAYKTEKDELDDPQMSYDMTLQWYGMKRIPSTASNPDGLRARETSPNFILANAQIARSFSELFDLYIGIENLLDFRQGDPIIDPANPNGQYFDASLVWGPVTGRMIYAGLRYKL